MIHHQGDRYLLGHSLFDAAPQFDCHQRIHAEVEEPGVLADLRGIDTGHLGYRVAQVIGHKLLALLHGSVGESLDQLCCPGRRHSRDIGRLRLQLGKECPSARLLVERQETSPIDPGHDSLRRSIQRSGHDIGQTGKGIGRRQRPDPALIQSRPRLRVGHSRRPWTEIDADPRDALLAQAPGQPVEEGVCRTVGGLTVPTPHRGDRGGAEEEIQLQFGSCLAEMPSTPDLPGEDPVQFGVVQVAQRSGADFTCRVDDAC